jgi:hypothetical protein
VLLEGLSRVALLLTHVTVVDERVWKMFRLDMISNVAPAGMTEGAADVAPVPEFDS